MSEQEPRRHSSGGSRVQTGRSSSGQPRSRARRRKGGISPVLLYVIFVVGISVILATVAWVWANDILALNKEPHTAVIEIQEDDKLGDVIHTLKENGIIENTFVFRLFVGITGSKDKIAPGSYELDTDMDYRAILTNISASSPTRQQTSVTIPEGYTIDQIFALLEESNVSTVEKLQETAANHDYNFSFLKELPLGDYHRLEGYLFPDTYDFYIGQDPIYVINKMLVNFDAKLTDELREEISNSGYSIHDIITIASMIEKETDGEDQATISSVIYNRLKNTSGGTNGYLQIDATLVYINGGKVPTEADREIDSPYNTYLYQGLPAGPISNPGMVSIYAAIHPESTSYYYYVLNPETNRHDFSRTYSEHQAKVNRYSQS